MTRPWITAALINFLIAASLGALLRFAFVEEISWMNYKHILHTHSHLAMLGWLYLALYALIVGTFLPPERQEKRRYTSLFWLTQASVVGMLLSFPVQGYGLISITFSTLHILLSYLFVRWIWLDLPEEKSFSRLMLRTALVFMVLSTLGVWSMGPLMANGMRGSVWYYMAVQFYLHFQFNGWFLFAALALFFRFLEKHDLLFPPQKTRPFYVLLVLSGTLTYALAVAWSQPRTEVFLINGLGVFLQLLSLILLFLLIRKQLPRILSYFPGLAGILLRLALFSLAAKILVQSSVIIPFVAKAAYTIRNYVIGFIHLVLLGAMTSFVIAFALRGGLLQARSALSRLGIGLLVAGFLISEILLFLQGTLLWGAQGFMPFYYEMLFLGSALMPAGILILITAQLLRAFTK